MAWRSIHGARPARRGHAPGGHQQSSTHAVWRLPTEPPRTNAIACPSVDVVDHSMRPRARCACHHVGAAAALCAGSPASPCGRHGRRTRGAVHASVRSASAMAGCAPRQVPERLLMEMEWKPTTSIDGCSRAESRKAGPRSSLALDLHHALFMRVSVRRRGPPEH